MLHQQRQMTVSAFIYSDQAQNLFSAQSQISFCPRLHEAEEVELSIGAHFYTRGRFESCPQVNFRVASIGSQCRKQWEVVQEWRDVVNT